MSALKDKLNRAARALLAVEGIRVEAHVDLYTTPHPHGRRAWQQVSVVYEALFGDTPDPAEIEEGLEGEDRTETKMHAQVRSPVLGSTHQMNDGQNHRELFKSEYTRAVMAGASIDEGIFAGAQAIRNAIGDDDKAYDALCTLRVRLGLVLGAPSSKNDVRC